MRGGRVIVYAMIGAGMAVLYGIIKARQVGGVDTLLLICDGMTLPGVIFTGVGGLTFVSRCGVFDVMCYAVKGLGRLIWNSDKRESYCEYVAERRKYRGGGYEILAVGSLFLLAACALCWVYALG